MGYALGVSTEKAIVTHAQKLAQRLNLYHKCTVLVAQC